MDLTSLVTDNITELLVKIVKFTQIRQKILTSNINNIHSLGFVPKDLEVDAFSEQLNNAIGEHVQNRRLILCDTENIKFGVDGEFEIEAVIDEEALEVFETDRDEYLDLQIKKLLENSLNQRVAAELLDQKRGMIPISFVC